MGKLNQVVAVVASKKEAVKEGLTKAYHLIQKAPLFDGLSRVYTPKEDKEDPLPPEEKHIQVKVKDLISEVSTSLTQMFDTVATQDWSNCEARADVKVNNEVLFERVPVTHLMFLEKQVRDLESFITKLPTLDPSEDWHFNEAAGVYSTKPTQTVRTKKVLKALLKAPATKEHPAQTETYNEDVVAGTWNTVKFSGAIPAKDKNDMLDRVKALREGILKAREEANSIEAKPVEIGKKLFKFVFRNQ